MTGPLFPANYQRVWIRGTFIDLAGNPKTGTVVLTPSPAVLLDMVPKLVISGKPFSVDLDPTTGGFAVAVPATDDPDILPTGWTYHVTEPSGRSYNISVPISTPVLDSPGDPLDGQQVIELIDIVPAATPSSGTVQLMTGRGISSATVDSTGNLVFTYSDSTTSTAGRVGEGAAVVLTDAPTIATDATAGRLFEVTLGGNRMLGNPTGLIPDQRLTWRIRQDATGGRTLTFDSMFNVNAAVTGPITLSTDPSKKDYVAGIYDQTAGKIDVLAFGRGF